LIIFAFGEEKVQTHNSDLSLC